MNPSIMTESNDLEGYYDFGYKDIIFKFADSTIY